MGKVWNFVQEYSLLLICGAVVALIWANTSPEAYHHFVEYELVKDSFIGALHDDGSGHVTRSITLHWLVNDLLMAFFFALAGKEVWEAVALKQGSLRGKKALTPLIATAGGMLGPVSVYLLGALMVGKMAALANGWAIPTATDIAFSYLVGRMVFGAGHPAVGFLLLLAIADDAAGLIILAVFYPQGDLAPVWLLLSVAAGVGVYVLANWLPRRLDRGNEARPVSTFFRKTISFWPYAIAGALSWYGFYKAGIHPALGLLPIVPAIPHADVDYGIFADAEKHLTDLLNHIEHMLKRPVEVILLGFGLMNAGVEFSAIGDATWLVLAGLIVGKPFGILLFGWIGARVMGFGLPVGMKTSDLFVLGCVAAIGFTVSLFVAAVAFPPGDIQDAAKMGALMSFGAAGISLIMGKVFKSNRMAEAAQPAE
ncbi:sodium:proton antiporter [Brevirhabdus pacifica]|uniref:Na(+)/H(+) antiporter NhaA n=1 Tax=Brevirhabdus pacifica TaxID=1267768 RepID=A0A1U7DK99_9RHOB|nr:Na+/H+ antiporter NhaA [Brevirhabdus pacifica]APX90298.1 sodium:proton antiporter [Brevirhabdus pacifica]OWU78658.1 sodium:proton antiporter [Loktanella sp. 22II-4b]PJJ80748.1 sodium/proton antiporter (NhaA family) [Brevirhabdus pacifica]